MRTKQEAHILNRADLLFGVRRFNFCNT